MKPALDPRLTPARTDLAAERLRGLVEAEAFTPGVVMQVIAPCAPLRRAPRFDAPLDTEALRGETVIAYEISSEGWAWVECERDGYVGYIPSEALRAEIVPATHYIRALRSFLYPDANIKSPPLGALPLGALVASSRLEGDFHLIDGGAFVWARHLSPIGEKAPDFVAEAERMIGAPYLWGGRSTAGMDCSALIQNAMELAGMAAPRDSDLQEMTLGVPLNLAPDLSGLRRGDLVFWKGHIGVMRDAAQLLHANGHHMEVVSEPLAAAAQRVREKGGGEITSARRLANSVA